MPALPVVGDAIHRKKYVFPTIEAEALESYNGVGDIGIFAITDSGLESGHSVIWRVAMPINFRTFLAASICLLAAISVADAQYSGGSGEPNDPYKIATAKDLILLGETSDDYDKHFILTAEIDLDPNLPGRKVFDRAVIAPDMNDVAREFQGIPFTGVFDGDGHRISNLTIEGGTCLGLFGKLAYPAKILHVGLQAMKVSGTSWCAGGLVGWNDRGNVTSAYTTGTINGTTDVGGFIGYNEWGHVTDCHSSAAVIGLYYVGGLVGGEQMGSICSSYSTGGVSGDWEIGGLVGDVQGGSIVWSFSTGSVIATGEQAGGLVGSNYWGLITTSYSTGAVSGADKVGGLVGKANGSCRIVSSYSASAVNGISDVGGLVGKLSGDSCIESSYGAGRVSGTVDVGGLVGDTHIIELREEENISSSFWDTESSGQTTSAGGLPKTMAEMKDIQTFLSAGWDFETVWMMTPEDYPRLERRGPEGPNSNGWIRLSPMKMARDQFAGGIIGDEIFVFGGNAMGGRDLFSGEKYNIATDTWSDIADNPHYQHPHEPWLGLGVEELSGIGFNGKLYVFGAQGGLNYNEVYDPATNTWATLAKKPTTTVAAIPVVYRDKIYLFGGSVPDGEPNDDLCTKVEAYDPGNDSWEEEVTEIPKQLDTGKAIAVHGNRAYVIGGYDPDTGEGNYEVMAYDFDADEWIRDHEKLPPDAAWWYSYATQAPVVNGKVYLIGGAEGKYPENYWISDRFTILDIEAKQWDRGPALPEPRDGPLTVVVDNTVYVVGGANGLDNHTDTVFAYTLPGTPGLNAAVGVYRLWSETYSRHFYTIDESEKEEFLQDVAGGWQDEGVVYRAFSDADEPNAAPVYQLFSENLNSHFYTISEGEKDRLINDYADVWTYEKIAFYVFPEGQQPADASPVYRFWSDVLGCHFYMIDKSERNKLINNHSDVWTYEGIAWYACKP